MAKEEPKMLRILIIEDESAAVQNLHYLLSEVAPTAQVVGVIESVAEAVEELKVNTSIDLILLDIHLADGNSFAIFDQVELPCPVVFTTAYDNYAVEAFRVNGIDYLLKPLKANDLKRALDRVERFTAASRELYMERLQQVSNPPHSAFLIPIKDRLVPLHTQQIAFCYTTQERVYAYTQQGEVLPLKGTLDQLSTQLPEKDFFRVNRQFIVARAAISEMKVWLGSRLHLITTPTAPEQIIISKARRPAFKSWFVGE